MRIPSEEAQKIIELGRAEAAKLGKALSFAVVDAGGYIVHIERMDGARPMTPSIALSKAYSAAVMQRPITMLTAWSESDPVFFSQVGRMGWQPIVAGHGGVTIKKGTEFLGGIGVSGGSPHEDEDIAQAILVGMGYDTDFAAWAGAQKK